MFLFLSLLLVALPLQAAANFDASGMNLSWCLPFVGILLSLAFLPMLTPRFWHQHNGKICLFWGLATLVPLSIYTSLSTSTGALAHTWLFEYVPFIVLISVLYTITGGIRLELSFQATPLTNTGLLTTGALLASVVGTTGAAMLLIRPLLALNNWRRYKTHLVVFFIFSVCNIGGCLTAIGDPPLLLGYLKGIDFFWPTRYLAAPFFIVMVPLMSLFFIMDYRYYQQDVKSVTPPTPHEPSHIQGKFNFLLLGLAIVIILLSSKFQTGKGLPVMGMFLPLESLARDISLVVLALISLRFSSQSTRLFNGFSWAPILEVAKLFAAIFVTVIPILAILEQGKQGALAPLIKLVTVDGHPVNTAYFWLTGILSSFLDNAPTYLVFFHMTGQDAATLMTAYAKTLTAISAGAVFMGALTYIGNAPNFLVKSIAESEGVRMPSFFGYIGWSISILSPLFVLVSLFLR